MKKVAILLINFRTVEFTEQCISSLKKISYHSSKIYVLDNGSQDNSSKKLKRIKGINLSISNTNLGFAEGNNILIRKAIKDGADYVILLNNDTVVKEDFISELLTVAESSSDIGIVGPKIYYFEPKNKIWFAGGRINFFIGDARHIGVNQIDNNLFTSVKEVDYITGCAMLVKREVIDKIVSEYPKSTSIEEQSEQVRKLLESYIKENKK